jgi:hypothetical protein
MSRVMSKVISIVLPSNAMAMNYGSTMTQRLVMWRPPIVAALQHDAMAMATHWLPIVTTLQCDDGHQHDKHQARSAAVHMLQLAVLYCRS